MSPNTWASTPSGEPRGHGRGGHQPGPPTEDDVLVLLPGQVSRFMRLARDHPRVFAVVAQVTQYRGKGRVAEILESARMRGQHPTDVEVLHRPEIYGAFPAAAAEGGRQPRAYTNEALIIWNQPWGVSLDTFPVPVHVFTGDGDLFRPFAERRADAGATGARLPGGHVSGFVPEVMHQVTALLRE